MATKQDAVDTSAEKDPSEWVTGGEPMTGPQHSYLNTLAHEAGEQVSDELTKAEASEKIEELQEKTGRGKPAAKAKAAPKKRAAKKTVG